MNSNHSIESVVDQTVLTRMYLLEKLSVSSIAKKFSCSQNKINYWLKKFNISKRSISEAAYVKHNPNGDPFLFQQPKSVKESLLFGIGIGLYWGEGTKSNKNSVRLGNTDPCLINKFIYFLEQFFSIKKQKLKFGLQIFNDTNSIAAKKFWIDKLHTTASQFQKVVITPSRGIGNYRKKSSTGVLTVYYHNKKLRNLLMQILEKNSKL